MRAALEPKPLIVAAAIGAIAFWALRRGGRRYSDFAAGALVGVAVQFGVRLVGVS
jgi:hypothetical protein